MPSANGSNGNGHNGNGTNGANRPRAEWLARRKANNADGNFSISIPDSLPTALVARAERTVGDEKERYAWIVPTEHPVIVAIRSGKGLIIRTGLASWARRLGDPNVSTLTRRAWTLLSR